MNWGAVAVVVTLALVVGAIVGFVLELDEAPPVAASVSTPMNSSALPGLIAVAALFLAWMGWVGYFDP